MTQVARELVAFNGNPGKRIVQLLVTIPAKALSSVQADPQSGPNDKRNWDAFVGAADALDTWALTAPAGLDPAMTSFLKQYASWQQVNMTETGSATPDRNQLEQVVTFPAEWTSLSSTSPAPRVQIAHSLWAAQRFMNFCAAVHQLSALQTTDAITPAWEGLLTLMTTAIQQDLSVDFLRPAALAIMQLCKHGAYELVSPTAPDVPVDHFSIAIGL